MPSFFKFHVQLHGKGIEKERLIFMYWRLFDKLIRTKLLSNPAGNERNISPSGMSFEHCMFSLKLECSWEKECRIQDVSYCPPKTFYSDRKRKLWLYILL